MFSLFAVILYLYAMYPSYSMYHVPRCIYVSTYICKCACVCVCVGDSAVCHNVAVKFKAKQRCKNYGNCCKTVDWTM